MRRLARVHAVKARQIERARIDREEGQLRRPTRRSDATAGAGPVRGRDAHATLVFSAPSTPAGFTLRVAAGVPPGNARSSVKLTAGGMAAALGGHAFRPARDGHHQFQVANPRLAAATASYAPIVALAVSPHGPFLPVGFTHPSR
jgi:hypothetical protein